MCLKRVRQENTGLYSLPFQLLLSQIVQLTSGLKGLAGRESISDQLQVPPNRTQATHTTTTVSAKFYMRLVFPQISSLL
jgi:hypothetical protein